ncbi:MAG: hypothetical protein K2Y56_09795 [Methylobacterium sp.]|uniref:hypothetical protein n=1 Tax=Methylobacterium sp. TaxID=409 RepID=UPI0025E10099|nr:hypothetical protein [Methylobacterium sp.]MBX9931813.1 hypothetical protein [Methylobacterium sp.]
MTLSHVIFRRGRVCRAGPRPDASVALIMFVMMSLVFGPIIGVHLVAAFAPADFQPTVVSHSSERPSTRG